MSKIPAPFKDDKPDRDVWVDPLPALVSLAILLAIIAGVVCIR